MTRRIMCIAFLALSLTARAELTTNKPTYFLGEVIEFTLTNDTPDELTWGSLSWYPEVWRLEEDGREAVRELPLFIVPALGLLTPDESTVWEWDQRDYFQWCDLVDFSCPYAQVEPGDYVARFETLTHGVLETPEFEISDIPLPVEPKGKVATTWAALKGR